MISIFVDSDILIDLLAQREDYLSSSQLLSLVMNKKIKASTTPLVFANVHYILLKYSNKLKAKKALKMLRTHLSIIPINQSIVDKALQSDWSDFEDSLQYFSIELQQLDYIVTRNKKDFKKSEIKVVTATEFVEVYQASQS